MQHIGFKEHNVEHKSMQPSSNIETKQEKHLLTIQHN